MFVKKTALALTVTVAILLVFAVGVAYYVSVDFSSQKENSLPSVSPTAETSSTPITSSPSSSPASASFASPLSTFVITSPTNSSYNSNTLTLNVTGQVIRASNVELFMNYSRRARECLNSCSCTSTCRK
jgi:hypothetical protein